MRDERGPGSGASLVVSGPTEEVAIMIRDVSSNAEDTEPGMIAAKADSLVDD